MTLWARPTSLDMKYRVRREQVTNLLGERKWAVYTYLDMVFIRMKMWVLENAIRGPGILCHFIPSS